MFAASSSALDKVSKEDRQRLFFRTTKGDEHNGLPNTAPTRTLGAIQNADSTTYNKWRKAKRADRSYLTSTTDYHFKVSVDYDQNKQMLAMGKRPIPGIQPGAPAPLPSSAYATQFVRPTREQIMSATAVLAPPMPNLRPVGIDGFGGDVRESRSHEEHAFRPQCGRSGAVPPPKDDGTMPNGAYSKAYVKSQYGFEYRRPSRSASTPQLRQVAPPHPAAAQGEDVFYETRTCFMAPGR